MGILPLKVKLFNAFCLTARLALDRPNNERIHARGKDATIQRPRELDEAKEKPFFNYLERSVTTTTGWNLDPPLG